MCSSDLLAIAVMIGDGCCAFVSISLGQNEVPKACLLYTSDLFAFPAFQRLDQGQVAVHRKAVGIKVQVEIGSAHV